MEPARRRRGARLGSGHLGSARHRAANPEVDSGHGLPWRHRTAWLVAAFMALQSWLFYSCLAWVAPSFQDRGWDATTTGYLLSVFSGVQVCSGLLGPLLADRVHDRRVLLLSASVFGAAGLLGLAVAPGAAPWLWVALLGMGQGPAFSLGMVLLIDYSRTPQGSGRLAAMVLFVSYTVAAWGPTTMGAVRDATGGFRAVWAVLLGLAVVQTMLVTRFRRTPADTLTALTRTLSATSGRATSRGVATTRRRREPARRTGASASLAVQREPATFSAGRRAGRSARVRALPVDLHEGGQPAGLGPAEAAVGLLDRHDRNRVGVVEVEGDPGSASAELHPDDLSPGQAPGGEEVADDQSLAGRHGPDRGVAPHQHRDRDADELERQAVDEASSRPTAGRPAAPRSRRP